MALDLYPYSGTRGGAVTDSEHGNLWSIAADGVPPGAPSTSFSVAISGGSWTAQPGSFLLAGRVMTSDSVISGSLPGGSTSTRTSIVVAYIDRSKTPWEYGVRVHLGSPGGGRPSLSTSSTGLYEVPLRAFDISSSGATTAGLDERALLRKVGAAPRSAEGVDATDLSTSATTWQTGTVNCSTTFVAPVSGAANVHTFVWGRGGSGSSGHLAVAFYVQEFTSAGTLIRDATLYDGPVIPPGTDYTGLGASKLVTGLTPGKTYYARTAHRSTVAGVAVNISHRRITVIPA